MKAKYLIRGIGIGIILGVLILFLAFEAVGRKNPYLKSYASATESESQIKTTEAKTTEAKTTEAKTTEAKTTEAKTTEAKTTEAKTTEAKTTEAKTTEAKTTEAKTTEAKTTEAKKTDSTAKATTESTGKTTVKSSSITVSSGMGSEDVSALLQQAGIINDAGAYNTWLIQNGYDARLMVGTFEIPSGSSDEEIAKILTTQGK